MFKKLLTSVLILLLIITTVVLTFFFFRREQAPTLRVVNGDVAPAVIGLTGYNIEEYVCGSDQTHYFLFFRNDADFDYIINFVINPLLSELRTSEISYLYFVDFTDFSGSPQFIQNTWGVMYLPAFVAVRYENRQIITISTLQWDIDTLLDANDLRDWLIENEIWNGSLP